MKAMVYRNLRTGGFSIRSHETQRVVEPNCRNLWLDGAKFNVRQGGRRRVLQEKQKNVHAFVIGYVIPKPNVDGMKPVTAYYNPFKMEGFVNFETGEPLKHQDYIVHMFVNDKGICEVHAYRKEI